MFFFIPIMKVLDLCKFSSMYNFLWIGVVKGQGRIQDFLFRGAQNIMCMLAHHESEPQSPLQPGSRALKGTG